MTAECFPPSTLPHLAPLYADYLALPQAPPSSPLRQWYSPEVGSSGWMRLGEPVRPNPALAEMLRLQADSFGAGPEQLRNIDLLASGARAVVTGQQVGLFGGPLLTLLKAATAVARARQATEQTGVPHVPVFWLASEDHDLAEVDQVTLPAPDRPETLSLGLRSAAVEVGGIALGEAVRPLLGQAADLLSHAPVCDLLARCYVPSATLGGAFARLITALFARHGLIVMDASTRDFHALGASTLRAAIERAEELEAALLARTHDLEAAGYAAQVLVRPGASLLFLLHGETGERQPLRRLPDETWKAGGQTYRSADLLAILDSAPERLSPNALLRPVFEDTILPTAAYIGGPAEVSYFAQSAVLYERVLGRTTPVLPRFSATLIPPAAEKLLKKHGLSLPDLWSAGSRETLTHSLGARAMPPESKRALTDASDALDAQLSALTSYLASLSSNLGRSAEVSASKMRYQMNRLRRMSARFELEKDASLGKDAAALANLLYPGGHLQERVLAGVAFLAQEPEPGSLIQALVSAAADLCPGHVALTI